MTNKEENTFFYLGQRGTITHSVHVLLSTPASWAARIWRKSALLTNFPQALKPWAYLVGQMKGWHSTQCCLLHVSTVLPACLCWDFDHPFAMSFVFFFFFYTCVILSLYLSVKWVGELLSPAFVTVSVWLWFRFPEPVCDDQRGVPRMRFSDKPG